MMAVEGGSTLKMRLRPVGNPPQYEVHLRETEETMSLNWVSRNAHWNNERPDVKISVNPNKYERVDMRQVPIADELRAMEMLLDAWWDKILGVFVQNYHDEDGRIRTRWFDQQGRQMTATELVNERVQVLEPDVWNAIIEAQDRIGDTMLYDGEEFVLLPPKLKRPSKEEVNGVEAIKETKKAGGKGEGFAARAQRAFDRFGDAARRRLGY